MVAVDLLWMACSKLTTLDDRRCYVSSAHDGSSDAFSVFSTTNLLATDYSIVLAFLIYRSSLHPRMGSQLPIYLIAHLPVSQSMCIALMPVSFSGRAAGMQQTVVVHPGNLPLIVNHSITYD